MGFTGNTTLTQNTDVTATFPVNIMAESYMFLVTKGCPAVLAREGNRDVFAKIIFTVNIMALMSLSHR
jgi:hypothetical protein